MIRFPMLLRSGLVTDEELRRPQSVLIARQPFLFPPWFGNLYATDTAPFIRRGGSMRTALIRFPGWSQHPGVVMGLVSISVSGAGYSVKPYRYRWLFFSCRPSSYRSGCCLFRGVGGKVEKESYQVAFIDSPSLSPRRAPLFLGLSAPSAS